MTQAAPLSFDLNQEMLDMLGQRLDIQRPVSKLVEILAGKRGAEAEEAARGIFEDYGREWAGLTLQLGERHSDRTYQVLKEVVDRTGSFGFALIPQRFVEIAYLSTQQIRSLPIVENNNRRLAYEMRDCRIFEAVKERCGEAVANMMACRQACLTLVRSIYESLGLAAAIEMEASLPQDGCCRFAATRA
jgi:hypothetical protein